MIVIAVVRQKEERSFHIMYYLSDGLGGSAEGKALFLEKPPTYTYLSKEHRKVPGLNDGAMYRSMVSANQPLNRRLPYDKHQQACY